MIRQPIRYTFQQNIYQIFWRRTQKYLNFWSWHIQINWKSWNMEFSHNSIEFRRNFKSETQSVVIKFLATTHPKNIRIISFDNQSVVFFNKICVANFGNILEEVLIFEVDGFISIKYDETLIFYKILSEKIQKIVIFWWFFCLKII